MKTDTTPLAGLPTAPARAELLLTARDAKGATAERRVPLVIRPAPPAFSTPERSVATLGQPFALTFQADSPQGGPMDYHGFTVTGDPLPAGMRYDRERHRLAGVPATTGETRFALTVTDSAGAETRRSFILAVPPYRGTLSIEDESTAVLTPPVPPGPATARLAFPDGFACPGRTLTIGLADGAQRTVSHAAPGAEETLSLPRDSRAERWLIRLPRGGGAPCTVPFVLAVSPDTPAP